MLSSTKVADYLSKAVSSQSVAETLISWSATKGTLAKPLRIIMMA
jgi:hypothetical protein